MLKLSQILKPAFPAFLAAALLFGNAGQAYAAVMYFPGVTGNMAAADYWTAGEDAAGQVLLDMAGIDGQNRRMAADPACCMNDLEHGRLHPAWDISRFYSPDIPVNRVMAERIYLEICNAYTNGGYWDRNGNPIDAAFAEKVRSVLDSADPDTFGTTRYGIVTRRTDLRAYPTDEIITDEKGDIDFDYVELSGAAVNEPLIIQGESAGGEWYYCCTGNCGGWIRSSDAAVCRDRAEWLSAWKIPANRVLVVTDSRFALEYSNTEPALSGLVLTMGTILERADGDGPLGVRTDGLISNRSAYQNHVVWIPVRGENGAYRKVKALISERHKVHEGYLPLTRRNILDTAMNALGDAYGWGGMLSAEDCSGFLRGIYACFGMNLPRNTTWQSAAPLFRFDLGGLPDAEKAEVIRSLPAGSMLYFKGHAMLYLGEKDGEPYVLSSVSSVMNPDGSGKLRVRSVIINNLGMKRANGNSWLASLHTAVIPWKDAGADGSGFRQSADGLRFRRDNGSYAAMDWQQIGEDWYYFDQNGILTVNRWIPSRTEAGTWYYVGADGRMAKDTVIDGWAVDAEGAWRE